VTTVIATWLPKVREARAVLPDPNAREMMLLPPMPMAIPVLLMRNVMGMTTVMAPMASGPTQRPTKMVSTIM
jgi:hypothetical protein